MFLVTLRGQKFFDILASIAIPAPDLDCNKLSGITIASQRLAGIRGGIDIEPQEPNGLGLGQQKRYRLPPPLTVRHHFAYCNSQIVTHHYFFSKKVS